MKQLFKKWWPFWVVCLLAGVVIGFTIGDIFIFKKSSIGMNYLNVFCSGLMIGAAVLMFDLITFRTKINIYKLLAQNQYETIVKQKNEIARLKKQGRN